MIDQRGPVTKGDRAGGRIFHTEHTTDAIFPNDHDRHDDHDREYERGYQAGLYGGDYDRHDSEAYHDGYFAGQTEATNRRASATRFVSGAPDAAQRACSRRADEFQNRPYGSSVPVNVQSLGRGDYELTMATGSYRSRCVVTAGGNVRSMEPY